MEVPPLTRDDQYSANIRAEIDRQKRSQIDVAMAAGVPWPQWQRRINGPVAWRADELHAVALALDVPLDRLVQERP